MNRRMVFFVTGRVVIIIGLLMILPILIGLCFHEGLDTLLPIVKAALCAIVFGLLLTCRPPKNRSIHIREGIAITSLSWLLTVFFGALPFVFSSAIPSLVDAFFESASGFTTTGSSIINDIEALPNSLLFWRSFTHFIGGMGVLMFAIALLPGSSSENIYLLKAEVPGPTFEKVLSRIREVARTFYIIYAVFALVLFCVLMAAGMTPFDAIIHTFSTAGTGGFSNYNDSVAHFNSVPIELILSVGMLMFGVNFNLYFFALRGHWKIFVKSEELRWYLGIVLVAMIALTASVANEYDSLLICLKDTFFTVSTVITTTGFGTVDFVQWPLFSQLIILMLMFIGGCAGSTAGGLKVSRIVLYLKMGLKKFRQASSPNRINVVTYENKPIGDHIQNDIALYFFLYIGVFCTGILLLSFENLDFGTTVSAVTTTFNNIGPGLGDLGPKSNFSTLSDFSKIVLSFVMIAGRLEIVPLILLFAPSTWRR